MKKNLFSTRENYKKERKKRKVDVVTVVLSLKILFLFNIAEQ